MKIVRLPLIFSLCFFISLLHGSAFAVERAPRISDREIIESLADLKATQKIILQRFGQIDERFDLVNKRFEQIDKRFEQIDRRFEQIDRRFDEYRTDMLTRFEQIDKRIDELRADMLLKFEQIDKRMDELRADMVIKFDQVNKRLDDVNANNRLFFGFIFGLLLTLFGYIIWDRRTLLKPLEEKIVHVERELEIGAQDGSKIKRLIETLRELSKKDEQVASALRQFHLL